MKTYSKKINGADHTFQLSDEDAVKAGLDPAKDSIEDAPVAESPLEFGTPATDGQDVEANVKADQAAAEARAEALREAEVKASAAANKSRTASNKAATDETK
jgi:hypothetical protein